MPDNAGLLMTDIQHSDVVLRHKDAAELAYSLVAGALRDQPPPAPGEITAAPWHWVLTGSLLGRFIKVCNNQLAHTVSCPTDWPGDPAGRQVATAVHLVWCSDAERSHRAASYPDGKVAVAVPLMAEWAARAAVESMGGRERAIEVVTQLARYPDLADVIEGMAVTRPAG